MSRPNKLIQFYLTNMCNSRCKTCNIWQNNKKEELDVENVIDVIRQYPEADYVFGGGEFTLYSHKNTLLEYCNKQNINYTILSNAVGYGRLVDILNFYKPKNLTISCDGKKHDEIRGVKNNLKNIESIITKYKDIVPNLKISYTLSKFNENHIDEDMEYFKNLGFDKIYFCIAQNMDLLSASGEITPEFNSIMYIYEAYQYMLYDKDVQLLKDIIDGKHKKCDSTDNVHTIYTNGDVVVCQSYLSYYKIGNIYDSNFSDIISRFKGVKECKYNDRCELVCQRRYDYEDRI